MWRLIAPFGITLRQEKIAYCNVNVVEKLIALGIPWKMTDRKISFCGRTFPMKNIDNGECEAFIRSLVNEGQSKLDIWRR